MELYAFKLKFSDIHVGGQAKISAFGFNELSSIHNIGNPENSAPVMRRIITNTFMYHFFFPTIISPSLSDAAHKKLLRRSKQPVRSLPMQKPGNIDIY